MGLYKAHRPSHLCCYEILHIPDAMEYSMLKFYDIIMIFSSFPVISLLLPDYASVFDPF